MRNLLGAVSFLALSIAASGATAQDWYGAVDLGWHTNDSTLWKSTRDKPSGSRALWEFETDDDWAGFARVGRGFDGPFWRWRGEFELGYRPGDVSDVFGRSFAGDPRGLCALGQTGLACDPVGGDFNQWTVMANGYYDFMPDSRFNPFIGGGIGMSRIDADIRGSLVGNGGVGPAVQDVTINDDDLGIALQGLAGFSWAVADNWDLDFTYRALWARHKLTVSYDTPGGIDVGAFNGNRIDHSLTLGLRYTFGSAPPPPPPPPSAPPPPPPPPPEPPAPPPPAIEVRDFTVYFPFDQYVLTPEAQAVVQEAAAYARQGGASRIIVTGHADTSGSAAYNVRLSERRAKAVADTLIGLGVDGTALSVDWKGESEPAVATGDGVKEPLNRRATININP